MYSLMLAAALSGNAAVPATCWHRWCGHGCYAWSCACYGCGCWSACHGCYGGWSWCGGCACYGCYACHGCHTYACYGCYGCYSYACYGCYGCYGVVVHPPAPKENKEKKPEEAPAPKPAPGTPGSAQAKVVIEVPAEARLYFDDTPIGGQGKTERTFVTPPLEQGKDYYYVVKAEVVRDGQTVSESHRLIVRAGTEARASLLKPALAASGK